MRMETDQHRRRRLAGALKIRKYEEVLNSECKQGSNGDDRFSADLG